MASGTAPNTSIVLTEQELNFINTYYNGSKSAAIHKAMEILMGTYDYTVIEDNGGGLHLFLFHPGSDTPARYFADFEYNPGSLVQSLDALDAGDDTSTWEGARDDATEAWAYINGHDFGYEVICYGENGQRTVKPDKMGAAGQVEFGVAEL
jgi:hypothetical protein